MDAEIAAVKYEYDERQRRKKGKEKKDRESSEASDKAQAEADDSKAKMDRDAKVRLFNTLMQLTEKLHLDCIDPKGDGKARRRRNLSGIHVKQVRPTIMLIWQLRLCLAKSLVC